MKKLILIIVLIKLGYSVFAQEKFFHNSFLTFNLGMEEHDERLFNIPDKNTWEEWQEENNSGFFGTNTYSLIFNKSLFKHQRFYTYIGSGIEYSISKTFRPFDQSHFGDFTRILRSENRYKEVLLPIRLNMNLHVFKNITAFVSFISRLYIFKSINHTKNDNENFPYTELKLDFDSFELMSGLSYNVGNIKMGLSYRLFNFQKIDKILFFSALRYPRDDQKYETVNPVKFEISIGYKLGKRT